jgi:hypothetical protein
VFGGTSTLADDDLAGSITATGEDRDESIGFHMTNEGAVGDKQSRDLFRDGREEPGRRHSTSDERRDPSERGLLGGEPGQLVDEEPDAGSDDHKRNQERDLGGLAVVQAAIGKRVKDILRKKADHNRREGRARASNQRSGQDDEQRDEQNGGRRHGRAEYAAWP